MAILLWPRRIEPAVGHIWASIDLSYYGVESADLKPRQPFDGTSKIPVVHLGLFVSRCYLI